MTTVGIIANPASGKDIRRLIAHGSVFDNQEKVNIVRRVLLGLESAGVEEVLFMPDYFGIGNRAISAIQLKIKTSVLDMRMEANQDDSTHATQIMRELGVGAIITLGGDGTNRAVAKEIGDIPIMPISTGTNNVFPKMIEGTIAGLAAGYVATGRVPMDKAVQRQLRLEIKKENLPVDIALIDVVVYDETFLGSRAVWEMDKVREIVLTQASPSNIGLSSVGGSVFCSKLNHHHGVYLRVNEGHGPVELTAPIAPGLVETLHISGFQLLDVGTSIDIHWKPSILALDGEREIIVNSSDDTSIELSDRGPMLINTKTTMEEAAKEKLLTKVNAPVVQNNPCWLCSIGMCMNPPQSCLLEK